MRDLPDFRRESVDRRRGCSLYVPMLTLGDLSAFTLFVRCRNCQRQEVMQVTSLPPSCRSLPLADALGRLRRYRCRALGGHVVELRWHSGRPPP